MEPAVIASIIVAVIMAIGGPGLYQYLARRKDQPIKETEVDITIATSINKVALDTLESVNGIAKELRAELDAQKVIAEKRAAEADRRFREVEAQLRKVRSENRHQALRLGMFERAVAAWQSWFAGVEANWSTLRQHHEAPVPPKTEVL